MGGRDPVRELVLPLPPPPPPPVPPPLHVSCREESWPGMEMDLAVDGGLGRREGCDRGAPEPGGRRIYLMAPIPTPMTRVSLTS